MTQQTVTPTQTPEGFEPLRAVLDDAIDQAANGKGRERHGRGDPDFARQPMMQITKMVGPGFPLGQAIKKAQEASGMIERGENKAARRELLGAIVYLAGAAMHLPYGDRVQWPSNLPNIKPGADPRIYEWDRTYVVPKSQVEEEMDALFRAFIKMPPRAGDKARVPSQEPGAKTRAGGSSPVRSSRLRGFLDWGRRTYIHIKIKATDLVG